MLTGFEGFEDADLMALLPFAGLALGLIFGILAQRSRFCLRSAVTEAGSRLSPMAGIYAAALLVALIGSFALSQSGLIALGETRFYGESMPLGALLLGGALFGAGMVLTRGLRVAPDRPQRPRQPARRHGDAGLRNHSLRDPSRRAGKAGRVAFSGATEIEVAANGSLAGLLGIPALALVGFAALGLGALIWRSGARPLPLLMGAGVGLVIVGGWFATGALLFDEFDPRAAESLAFTAGASDGLFFTMASTALEPTFAAGIIGGTLVGSFLAAAVSRELRLESFETPQQTVRYLAGGALMGVGGVLAGGCTIGAGLTGVSTLAVAPLIALVAIIAGAKATQLTLEARGEARRVDGPCRVGFTPRKSVSSLLGAIGRSRVRSFVMRYALALIAALIPLPSEAENPIPEGDYVFVDEILKTSVEAGLIVPVYILVKSREDQLRVAFMTTFSPGTRDCSDYGKCDRTVEAIELDVEETEGRLAVTDSRTLSDATIDRQETDKSLIVAPTQIFIDGAAVSVGNDPSIPRVVTLTKKDARVARLIPASRDFVESAVDFARTTDLALSRLDKCLIRQIATMSARHDRSPAATKLLAAVAHAGRTARLERQTRANDNVPEEGSQEWRDRLVAQMLRIASNPYGGDPKTPREALEAVVGTGLANKLGDEYELILEAAFAGHEAEVMAARRWAAAYKSARESHGSDAALGKRLCDDITLSE